MESLSLHFSNRPVQYTQKLRQLKKILFSICNPFFVEDYEIGIDVIDMVNMGNRHIDINKNNFTNVFVISGIVINFKCENVNEWMVDTAVGRDLNERKNTSSRFSCEGVAENPNLS